MIYLYPFTHVDAGEGETSGGKGANLALLTQRGFPVPPGGTVAAQAYRDFVRPALPFLQEQIQNLSADNPAALRQQAQKIQSRLGQLPLPPKLVTQVHTFLAGFPAQSAFSVRSSSTLEDLANAAFAGQHETYLNCVGPEVILERIRECYLSLWGDRAVAYRQHQGFRHLDAAMAVVIQQMVQCTVAGVGFSINPVSGDLSQAVFDANFGLGESVVSGESEVDHFVLDKGSGQILESIIAHKTSQILSGSQGTHIELISDADAGRPSLTEAELAELLALIRRVEESYQFPQDIEWGFADGQLFLLQSRPITTIPPRYTRDESAERFPNVITPLSWDFMEEGFHASLNFSFRLMGHPPYSGKWFSMHDHYIYGNQNAVQIYARRMPHLPQDLDQLMAMLPQIAQQFRWVQEVPILWARDLDYYLIRLGECMAEPLQEKNLIELWDFVLAIKEHGAQYFLPNIAISLTHGLLYRLVHSLLELVVGEAADQMAGDLLAYCETKTGLVNGEMFELAQLIRAEPELEKVLLETPSPEIIAQKRFLTFPRFQDRLDRFLRDHGHRETDLDAYQPTWIEAPWVVLDHLRLILQSPMEESPAEKAMALKIRMQQAEQNLFQQLPEPVHFLFSELIRLARLYTSLDDLEHYQTTRLALPTRRALRELGQRLVDRQALVDPMDIFFAHQTQLAEAVRLDQPTHWQYFGAEIREQKAAYLRDKARTPDWVLGETVQVELLGDQLSGLAGSRGLASGPVFKVLSPEDFARFPKGAVLVARTTNPTWTPLFYNASAVITESGGPLSHGAVTAREMGIPAVMSVAHVLSLLTNGQIVQVDGSQGKVYINP